MISIPNISGKKFYVLGCGKTGLGAIASLISSGAMVYAWDDSEDTRSKLRGIEVKYDESMECDYLFVSPGVPMIGEKTHPLIVLARKKGVKIVSDFDLLYSAASKAKFIGITGTNGKSTTTALVYHILRSCGKNAVIGGNIGNSVLDLPMLAEDGIYVLEASSYQLDLANEIKFDGAVLLNITPDHLDRHLTMENYISAKKRIFERSSADDVKIVSLDYDTTRFDSPTHTISTNNGEATVSVMHKILHDNTSGLKYDLSDMQYLPGKHNDENIAAAYALAVFACGCDANEVIDAIKTFKGLAHRMQLVAKVGDLSFINDSKATNADSTQKALESYKEVIWIVGGLAKTGGINSLSPLFHKVREAFLIGESEDDFAKTLEGKVSYLKCKTLESALRSIKHKYSSGVVLLSPACASWDQYKSFEERGEQFESLVKEIWANKYNTYYN